MRGFFLFSAFTAFVAAAPRPQDMDFDLIDSTPDPPLVTNLLEAPATVVYNPSTAVAAVVAAATTSLAAAATTAFASSLAARDIEKRLPACTTIATGLGPTPSVDSAAAFLSNPVYSNQANTANTPSGYTLEFQNLDASSNAYGYMGYSSFSSYDVQGCANLCTSTNGCSAFNILYERDPLVDYQYGNCDPTGNTGSTVFIKCVMWGGPVTTTNAVNTGYTIPGTSFIVAIAGSNGYVSNEIVPVKGYSDASYLGNAAINAPTNCLGTDTSMGSKIFTTGPFDAKLCAAACTSQNVYNTAHPPKTGSPKLCQFFNTYIPLKNGVPQGQVCVMYTQAWDPTTYGTNSKQYRGTDVYTVEYSYSYTNLTSNGVPAGC